MFNGIQRFWVTPIILAFFPACSSMPANSAPPVCPPTPVPMDNKTCQIDDLMQYYDVLSKFPASAVSREYDKVRQDFLKNKSDLNRLKAALLLSLPNTSFRDYSAALNLLEDRVPGSSDMAPDLRGFANFLRVMLTEQLRLIKHANDQAHHANDLTQKLKEEQKRTRAWQEKVDAIKTMEKNLIRRDKQ